LWTGGTSIEATDSIKGDIVMKRSIGVFAVLMLVAPAAMAYQVTGPVQEVTDTKVVVVGERDKEKYEIARDKDTKVTGELKQGARVTVEYRMTATKIEAKDTKAKDTKAPAKK
jgi:hypothetical protein